jgi:hypothetical protein
MGDEVRKTGRIWLVDFEKSDFGHVVLEIDEKVR